ncbi:TonB-dependent receptor [Hymenobacter weizhouensis]|uniref:TonB-dependent receptor n=1 Tax=Hymenobacter sp. YIM 151500-1 TaxID=2987689 RepID=UPI0022280C81|nr:TonB-dependent receptor [Hymenobacter sp. YIM 151500-1]UYZ65061.1 TonB-dependent receptor [Hymenobacter sp. YIM 151500-1]
MRHSYLLAIFFLLLNLVPLPGRGQTPEAGSQVVSGTVLTDDDEPLPGATIFLEGTFIGTSTDQNGRFSLTVPQFSPPVTVVVSFVGYSTREVTLQAPQTDLQVVLEPSPAQLNEVVVAASRIEETILRAPVTIEKISAQQIQKIATPEILGGLGQYKGIDVNSASMLFTSISTRGFNTAKSERVIQLYDYADMQLPSLSLSPGNMVGIPELDMESIEVVHGPSSALYGSNALNGVILFNSKDPFTYTGLSARVRGGQRSYLDAQVRYAQQLGPRIAFKVIGSYLTAREWIAQDYGSVSSSANQRGSLLGYNAVNRYGEQSVGLPGPPRFPQLPITGKRLYVPGYTEAELLADDDHTTLYRLMGTMAFLLRNDLKLSLDAKRAVGSATYQNLSRFRMHDFGTNQYKVELKSSRGFLRAYSTQDFSGDTYELESLGKWIQTANAGLGGNQSTQTYADYYANTWYNTYRTQYQQNGGSDVSAQDAAYRAAQAVHLPASDPRFRELRAKFIQDDNLRQGSRIRFNSILNDASGQYEARLLPGSSLVLGGAYREYRLGSGGKYFADQDKRLRNYEVGGYAQLSQTLLEERLKLAVAGRLDLFQNFDAAFSPRASAVYSAGRSKQHNFRASFGRAYRQPAQPEQYFGADLGNYYVSGNVGKGFAGYNFFYNGRPLTERNFFDPNRIQLSANAANHAVEVKPLQLERVRTWEVGYRGLVLPKLYLDVNAFMSRYQDFIGSTSLLSNLDGTRPSPEQLTNLDNFNSGYRLAGAQTRFVYLWTNSTQPVETRGAALGLNYYLTKPVALSFNYSYNELDRKGLPDNFRTFFNTPKHKYNLGASGTPMRNLSYAVNYRWVQGHFQEMPFAAGDVPTYSTFDAQVDYQVPSLYTTFQAGVSNLFNSNNVQVYGGPRIGRLAFVGVQVDLQ